MTTASPSGLTGTLGTVAALVTLQMRPESRGATASAASFSGDLSPPWPCAICWLSPSFVRTGCRAAELVGPAPHIASLCAWMPCHRCHFGHCVVPQSLS